MNTDGQQMRERERESQQEREREREELKDVAGDSSGRGHFEIN